MTEFPIHWVRSQFPALALDKDFVFFDNAAGAQIPRNVLDTVQNHLLKRNVQRGGRYRHSREVDAAIAAAREAVAVFLNARHPNEIAFGMNATSFIRIVSLALAQTLGDRREFIVTDLDHEANVATWLALERDGAKIKWWPIREDGRLHPEDLDALLTSKTRLVACTVASNAIGSTVDVADVARRVHAAGAELFLDCVHYGPHGPIDVQAFDGDYLVCSGYKIFSPHMGFLWGKQRALDALPTFREDFIPDQAPFKIEVGTYVYENVAGMSAVVDYLEELGKKMAANGAASSRRGNIVRAMEGIRAYEATLSAEMLRLAAESGNVTVYGVRDPAQVRHRTPTLCFNVKGVSAATTCERLAEKNIGVRDGNMYSPRLMKRLGVVDPSGAVRASLVHYNTIEEVRHFARELQQIAQV
jgi:cysteine desulfurase family protein (TIGR01976 family)